MVFSQYKYQFDFKDDISSYKELNTAKECYLIEKEAGRIDEELCPYLERFFDSQVLFPYFSCCGHEPGGIGNIMFRSLYPVEITVGLFKSTLLEFDNRVKSRNTNKDKSISKIDLQPKVDLQIHYCPVPAGGIAYVLYFQYEHLETVLTFFLEELDRRKVRYGVS